MIVPPSAPPELPAHVAGGELAVLDLRPVIGSERTGAGEAALASRRRGWDLVLAASALQGIVNRERPRLYLLAIGEGTAKLDRFWLDRLNSTWTKGWKEPRITGVEAAVARFRSDLKGAVVWDERVPATSNVAVTVAGVESLLPLRYDPAPDSLYSRLTQDPKGPRLPIRRRLLAADGAPMFTGAGTIPETKLASTGSAKCDAYLWAAETYLTKGKCAPGVMGYFPDAFWIGNPRAPLERALVTNADWVVARRGFQFDLSPWDDEAPDDDKGQKPGTDGATMLRLLRMAYDHAKGGVTHVAGFTPWDQKYTRFTGGKHGEVETEWRYAEILSCFNAFMDADAAALHAMANASVFRFEPLKARYPQTNLPTEASLKAKGYLLPDGSVAPKAYASVYMGDYDAASWLYTALPDRWKDPARGTIPLGWAFNPTLESRFGTGLAYAREGATPNDFFIAGDCGAGYLNPGGLQAPRKWSGLPSGVAAWEAFSRPLLRRWDLGITGFVIDGNSPAMDDATRASYARMTPYGVFAQKTPPLSMVGGTPFLRMGTDVPGGDLPKATEILANALPKTASGSGASFTQFRAILWMPSDVRDLFAAVKARRPDAEFVDPYTLTFLARRQQERAAAISHE